MDFPHIIANALGSSVLRRQMRCRKVALVPQARPLPCHWGDVLPLGTQPWPRGQQGKPAGDPGGSAVEGEAPPLLSALGDVFASSLRKRPLQTNRGPAAAVTLATLRQHRLPKTCPVGALKGRSTCGRGGGGPGEAPHVPSQHGGAELWLSGDVLLGKQ